MNLEKELIRQNRKIATPEELLVIREFETHTDLVENDALSRIGLTQSIKEGGKVKARINSLKDDTSRFNQERVFHISQIEATCRKYHLKFLPSSFYKGSIDKNLPTKITNFEAAYGVKLGEELKIYPYDRKRDSFIMAPEESFQLEERPKDPLLFYQINEEYFYLIHKWGNDLNALRGIWYSLMTSRLFFFLFFVGLAGVFAACAELSAADTIKWAFMAMTFVTLLVWFIWLVEKLIDEEVLPRFIYTSDDFWKNPYRD